MSHSTTIIGSTSGRWARMMLALVCAATLALALFAGPARADTFTVTNTNDSGPGSLRQAISFANANNERDTIKFSFTGRTITLTGSDLVAGNDVSGQDLTIDGPGADKVSVDGGGNNRVFSIGSGANAEIEGLTVTGGSAASIGGGIRNEGTLTLDSSTIRDSSAAFTGGGINNEGGTLTLNNSTISNNSAAEGGGGIYSRFGTLTVNSSTISGNSADGNLGGGIRSFNPNPAERTTIRNSTISGNETSLSGGGVYNREGITIIENTTITQNTASPGRGAGVAGFGNDFSRTEFRATIISNNAATDVDRVDGPTSNFESNGSNVVGDGNAVGEFNKTKDQTGVTDPKLGALANNGGPTETYKLLSGSPALDAADNACGVAKDQRGVPRPQDGNGNGSTVCDVGSFEKKETIAPSIGKISPTKATKDRTPTIRATVRDNATNLSKGNVKVFVDGRQKSGFSYNGVTGALTYTTGRLANKRHTVKIVATDASNNVSARSWAFTVDAVRPFIKPLSPKPRAKIRDRTPRIQATVKDNHTNLRKGNIKLYVDGKRKKNFRYNVRKNKLTYNSQRLSYKRHTVKISTKDAAGNVKKKSWRFKVRR